MPATRGSAFIEVLQNCNIFNDGAWRSFTDREVRDDKMLALEHGKPMIFGKDRDRGIRLRGLHPEVVQLGVDGVTEADILVHDEQVEDPTLAFVLSRMFYPDFPFPVGVIRDVTKLLSAQLAAAIDSAARAPALNGGTSRSVGRVDRRRGAVICQPAASTTSRKTSAPAAGRRSRPGTGPLPGRCEARLVGGRSLAASRGSSKSPRAAVSEVVAG